MQPMFAKVRFSDWAAILSTKAPEDDLHYARAIWHYGRGQAFVGLGSLKDAEAELAKLDALALSPEIAEMTFFNREGAPALTAIAQKVLLGELLAAKGDTEDAIVTLSEAVVLEDALPYTEPPEWFFPARHSLGELQIKVGDLAAAEKTYREDLRLMPENGWALKGLANVLAAQGKKREAADTNLRFKKAWEHAEVEIKSSRI